MKLICGTTAVGSILDTEKFADESDAAQERGEVAVQGKPSKTEGLATAKDIGLTYNEIHEARAVRDAGCVLIWKS